MFHTKYDLPEILINKILVSSQHIPHSYTWLEIKSKLLDTQSKINRQKVVLTRFYKYNK